MFSYYCFSHKYPHPLSTEKSHQFYTYWKKTWSDVLSQAGISLESPWLRYCQFEEIHVIVENDQIIGMACVDQFCGKDPYFEHPYFSPIDSAYRSIIAQHFENRTFRAFGQLSVHPDHRGHKKWTDVLLGLALLSLSKSNASGMMSYTRNQRKTNELTYRLGATALAKDLMIHDEASDIVVFQKNHLEPVFNNPNYFLINQFWNQQNGGIYENQTINNGQHLRLQPNASSN